MTWQLGRLPEMCLSVVLEDPVGRVPNDGLTPLFAVINTQWGMNSEYAQPRTHDYQETEYLRLAEALLEVGADLECPTQYEPVVLRSQQYLRHGTDGRNTNVASGPGSRCSVATTARLIWSGSEHPDTLASAGDEAPQEAGLPDR